MELNQILLVAAALFPAVALCIFVFAKDRVEKEPLGLLLLLLGLGALSCFPAAIIEELFLGIIDSIFTPLGTATDDGVILPDNLYNIYLAIKSFIGIALVEEGCKFVILYFATRKNRNFNSFFDGLIYSIFVSLGFAALENVLYVTEYGFINAIMRGILSVPGHMFFAVLMGYYYSLWKIHDGAENIERGLKSNGMIFSIKPPFTSKKYLGYGMILAALAHGFYDFYCFASEEWTTILYIFVIFLYIYCFRKINRMSKEDGAGHHYSLRLIAEKYPEVIPYFDSNTRQAVFGASDVGYSTPYGSYVVPKPQEAQTVGSGSEV